MSINRAILAAAAAIGLAAGTAVANEDVSSADLWLQKSDSGFTVEFVSDGQVSGLQFDVKGIQVVEGQFQCGVSVAETHTASCSINSDGNLRVIVYSMTNELLGDGTMVQISPRSRQNSSRMALQQASAGQGTVELANVVFGDAQGVNITPDYLQ